MPKSKSPKRTRSPKKSGHRKKYHRVSEDPAKLFRDDSGSVKSKARSEAASKSSGLLFLFAQLAAKNRVLSSYGGAELNFKDGKTTKSSLKTLYAKYGDEIAAEYKRIVKLNNDMLTKQKTDTALRTRTLNKIDKSRSAIDYGVFSV